MGQAIISRGGGVSGAAKAKVEIIAPLGATLTISQGDVVFTRVAETELVEISLGYGIWTISASGAETRTIEIDTIKVYKVNVRESTYGISIDMSNGDPAAAVTYTDDAVGFSALSCDSSSGACDYGSWEDAIKRVIGCKPCLYKDGARVGYLNPDDYTQFEDGSAADITSGDAGEVMVEFKKTWYKFAVSGDTLTFQVSNGDRSADGFVCSAFKSNDGTATVKDFMYFGVYEGYSRGGDNKCHSLSGKPLRNYGSYMNDNSWSYSTFRTNCQAFGSSYGMEDLVKRYYILGLLMLVTKTRGIQAAIGDGSVNGESSILSSGTMNTKGLFYGVNDRGKAGVKAFGIENLWGNTHSWCDGFISYNKGKSIYVKECAPYNVTSDYTTVVDAYVYSSDSITDPYPTKMIPVLDGAAIVASVVQSDSSIGWPDCVWIRANSGTYLAATGRGDGGDGVDEGGPFCTDLYTDPGYVSHHTGRLVSA